MALDDFRFVRRFRVAYHDIDMLQHANNAAYVVWLETVRCNYFDEVLGGSITGANSMIVARLEMNYEQPLGYREDVAIGCRVSRIGRKSFDVSFEIWSETRRQRAAYGLSTMVAYSYESKTSITFPEPWGEIIEAYEFVAPAV
jgi:acyl-CoA thioester hydrolase